MKEVQNSTGRDLPMTRLNKKNEKVSLKKGHKIIV